jgi:peptidoglycan-associated lipoprotein
MSASNRVVYFDFDSFAIRTEFQSALENHARLLKSDKTKKISIDGHTDERGGREYNLSLGQKRSEAVRKALALLGVSENQMEAVSFGKEKPAVIGSTEAAMEKNRRAEINYR